MNRINSRLENGQIPPGTLDIIPCVIHLAQELEIKSSQAVLERVSSRSWDVTGRRALVVANVQPVARLRVDVAREVPVQKVASPGNARGV